MEPEEIRENCAAAYKQIKDAETALQELRAICKHEVTYEGNWSWRIGNIQPAVICSDCGKFIKYIYEAKL